MSSEQTQQKPLRVGMITLGCAKNLVDAEVMFGSLIAEGIEITNDAADADALIVNTCSFIDSTQEESVDAILQSAQVRETRKPSQALIVSGCLPQRFREELPKLLPEVDAFIGIDQVSNIPHVVREALRHRAGQPQTTARRPSRQPASQQSPAADLKANRQQPRGTWPPQEAPLVQIDRRPDYIPDFATPRFRLTPSHFAYLKIAEGCNHPCSFCTIPRMRGSHRSRPQADVVQEARVLIDSGVKELNLISQDSTYYGLDLRSGRAGSIAAPGRFEAATKALPADSTTLCTLLKELNRIEGDFWVRLLYTHPAHWTDELIDTIAECPKVARYIDIPLQHIHGNMLERMRRETSQQYIVDLLRRIRAGIPKIALRTTFIVGFPGETQEYFNTLLDFVRKTRFERLGVFTYSKEEGTRAAKMAAHVPTRTKESRRKRVMAEQLRIARELGAAQVGRHRKVLVEKEATATELKQAEVTSWEHGLIRHKTGAPDLRGRYWVARGEADAPDIDGRIYIRNKAPVGQFVTVKVIGHTDYDLIAETV